MRDEYKKLFNFITMANINPYLKKVVTYQCLPDRNNYNEIKRLMDYYHVDTYGELLDILAQEYNYGDISEFISIPDSIISLTLMSFSRTIRAPVFVFASSIVAITIL